MPATTIPLAEPKVITPAVVISALTVDRIVDLPEKRIIRAFIRELPQPLVLWSGDAYDAIGDWTQVQANARILELLG